MARLLLGFDIGGTKIGIGLGDENGKLLGRRRIDNIDTDPDVILPRMLDDARELAAEAGKSVSDIAAFGISAPFPADAKNGILLAPTNNKRGNNVPILETFRRELGIPGCFENDANCGALAEWYFGAARNCRDFIYLTMSTGIGGGIVASGKLIRGGDSLSAGEMGHICLDPNGRKCNCGQRGCYESFCGGRAVANRMREELADKTDDLSDFVHADDDAVVHVAVDAVAGDRDFRGNARYFVIRAAKAAHIERLLHLLIDGGGTAFDARA